MCPRLKVWQKEWKLLGCCCDFPGSSRPQEECCGWLTFGLPERQSSSEASAQVVGTSVDRISLPEDYSNSKDHKNIQHDCELSYLPFRSGVVLFPFGGRPHSPRGVSTEGCQRPSVSWSLPGGDRDSGRPRRDPSTRVCRFCWSLSRDRRKLLSTAQRPVEGSWEDNT